MTDSLPCQKSEFHLPEDSHYLNCAYMSPMARRVESAGIEGIRSKRNPAAIVPDDFFRDSEAVRRAFADLIGARDALRISLAPAVSYGVASAAKNLDCAPGSQIVLLHEQFPSHVYTWRRLAAEKRLALKIVEPPEAAEERGRRWNERILDAIVTDTAAVCVPIVHWTDGTRYDLPAIAERARDVGAALIVDGTQSVGALPFSIEEVEPDCLVVAGYKWLMGPYSTALVYWGNRFMDGAPLEENWISRRDSEHFAALVDYRDEYQTGAVRFDVGERSNFILMPMLREGLKLVGEFDPARIQHYCRRLMESAVVEAASMGYVVEEPAFRSHHLFGIRHRDPDLLDRLKRELANRNVSVSVRGSAVRVAPNVYNDENDIDALMEALKAAL